MWRGLGTLRVGMSTSFRIGASDAGCGRQASGCGDGSDELSGAGVVRRSAWRADLLLDDRPGSAARDRLRRAGASHDYFLPYLLPLARHGRLVFIDERGSGKSEQLEDPRGYAFENMVEDVEAVRQGLRLGKISLFGHS
jgi:hypothetical protein